MANIIDRLKSRLGLYRDRPGRFKAASADRPESPGGPIERAFFGHDGAVIHKWHHYLPVYDRHFAPWCGKPVRLLEIGVFKGGSLALWTGYFAPGSTIVGIDIDPACAGLDVAPARVMIGSQDDPAFLERVVEAFGGEIDIVIDDGSHQARHMRRTFDILFPRVAEGGLYIVEDLHCAYWKGFGGGYRRPTFIEKAKNILDDMHHWYHPHGQAPAHVGVRAMHCYNSIIAFEKGREQMPVNSKRGRAAA